MSTGKMWENFERRQREIQEAYGGSSGSGNPGIGALPRAQSGEGSKVKKSPSRVGDRGRNPPPPGWNTSYDDSPSPPGKDNWSFSKKHAPYGGHPPYNSAPSGSRVVPIPSNNPYSINTSQQYWNDPYSNVPPPNYAAQKTINQHVPDPYSYTKGKRLEGHSHEAYPYPDQFYDRQAQAQATTATMAYGDLGQDDDNEIFEGLRKPRKCRDLICLGIFGALCLIMVAVLIYGAVSANDLSHLSDAIDGCIVDDNFASRSVAALMKPTSYYERPANITQRNNEPQCDYTHWDEGYGLEHDVQLWYYVLLISLIAIGLSFIMTILLRFFAAPIIWTVYVLMILLGIGVIAVAWVLYVEYASNDESGDVISTRRRGWSKNIDATLAIPIIVTLFAFLWLLVLFFMRKKVSLVIRLFKEAGKALHGVPFILFQPLWTLVAHGLVSGFFFLILAMMQVTRLTNYKNNRTCEIPTIAVIGTGLNVVAYLWMWQFILGCQHMIIAGAVSKWFFIRDKTNLGFPVIASYKQLIFYNLGSVAVGSFIIALVKFLRWVANRAKNAAKSGNVLVKLIACCVYCVVSCIEQLISYLCRNAYIEMAIYGYGFFPAAKRAAKVIMNNAFQMSAINSIGDFVLFLSKFLVVILSGVCGYFMLESATCTPEWLWIWTIIGVIFAYFIANSFMGVYEMTIDTIFICFCEDCEKNDGVNKPYFMSTGLMKFVQESAKANDVKEKKDS